MSKWERRKKEEEIGEKGKIKIETNLGILLIKKNLDQPMKLQRKKLKIINEKEGKRKIKILWEREL